jgi:hypothetical protein
MASALLRSLEVPYSARAYPAITHAAVPASSSLRARGTIEAASGKRDPRLARASALPWTTALGVVRRDVR